MSKLTIVDYGVGNLKSVKRAFEYAGGDVIITADPKQVSEAERLVLPGVGAFGHCMQELDARGLTDAVKSYAAKERPFLGICVGMQIMLSVGEEFGEHKGLGFIEGRIKKIPAQDADGKPHVLPYIGWAALHHSQAADWKNTPLQATPEGAHMYFLHSFSAHCADAAYAIAYYDYNGISVCAAINQAHMTGLQFHPEKSGEAGITIIKQFMSL
ncbi:MAG: imidazole glycerol phosphate synthase subunit HisH [Rickettsiales bacterium]|nr:imidazole glycerol phosphate synthase subunit HisH [Rickettsiales bacterium]